MSDLVSSNPSDANTNVYVVSTSTFWTWFKGNTDSTNIGDTIASTWPGAPIGNYKIGLTGFSSTNTTVILGNTNVIIITVPSVAAMKALSSCAGIGGLLVRGYSTPDDGGGGRFAWLANDPTPDDGMIYFTPNNEGNCPGRWKRTFDNGYYTGIPILDAGPVATNNTYIVARDFASTVGGPPIIWPRQTNQVNNSNAPLALISNQSMSGEDSNQILGNGTNAVFYGNGLTNFIIKGLSIGGGYTGIWLTNCYAFTIEGCAFSAVTNGIILDNCSEGTLSRNTFDQSVAVTITRNNSTNTVISGKDIQIPTGIYVGEHTPEYWGPMNSQSALVSYHDVRKGDDPYMFVAIASTSTNAAGQEITYQVDMDIYADGSADDPVLYGLDLDSVDFGDRRIVLTLNTNRQYIRFETPTHQLGLWQVESSPNSRTEINDAADPGSLVMDESSANLWIRKTNSISFSGWERFPTVTTNNVLYLSGVVGSVSWSSTNGVPIHAAANGSICSRTDGTGPNLYVRENGSWAPK